MKIEARESYVRSAVGRNNDVPRAGQFGTCWDPTVDPPFLRLQPIRPVKRTARWEIQAARCWKTLCRGLIV